MQPNFFKLTWNLKVYKSKYVDTIKFYIHIWIGLFVKSNQNHIILSPIASSIVQNDIHYYTLALGSQLSLSHDKENMPWKCQTHFHKYVKVNPNIPKWMSQTFETRYIPKTNSKCDMMLESSLQGLYITFPLRCFKSKFICGSHEPQNMLVHNLIVLWNF